MTAAGDRVLPDFFTELAASKKKPGGTCWYPKLILLITPPDRADLDIALADERYNAATISQVLRARGFPIAEVSVRRHRRRDCACPR